MYEWTVRDFVKSLCLRGNTDREVLAVARCTRWEAKKDEVREWLQKRGETWRRCGRNEKVDGLAAGVECGGMLSVSSECGNESTSTESHFASVQKDTERRTREVSGKGRTVAPESKRSAKGTERSKQGAPGRGNDTLRKKG